MTKTVFEILLNDIKSKDDCLNDIAKKILCIEYEFV